MNWMRYVRGEEAVVHKKSINLFLDSVMLELMEKNTLANWVRETNTKIGISQ